MIIFVSLIFSFGWGTIFECQLFTSHTSCKWLEWEKFLEPLQICKQALLFPNIEAFVSNVKMGRFKTQRIPDFTLCKKINAQDFSYRDGKVAWIYSISLSRSLPLRVVHLSWFPAESNKIHQYPDQEEDKFRKRKKMWSRPLNSWVIHRERKKVFIKLARWVYLWLIIPTCWVKA